MIDSIKYVYGVLEFFPRKRTQTARSLALSKFPEGVTFSEHRDFSYEVQWVTSSQHHTVRVQPGPAGTNMTTWDISDSGAVAAHKFGHMPGHPDEYVSASCPGRSPVNTGTVMDNNTPPVPARLMTGFANNIGSNVVGI